MCVCVCVCVYTAHSSMASHSLFRRNQKDALQQYKKKHDKCLLKKKKSILCARVCVCVFSPPVSLLHASRLGCCIVLWFSFFFLSIILVVVVGYYCCFCVLSGIKQQQRYLVSSTSGSLSSSWSLLSSTRPFPSDAFIIIIPLASSLSNKTVDSE